MQDTPPNAQTEAELLAADLAADTPTAEPTPEPANAAPSLEEQLKQARLESVEHHDAWLRAKAESENIRRRAAEDILKASKYAIEKLAIELLPVKDSLEQALAIEAASVETLREGVELTLRNLVRAFEKGNLTEINPLGEKFDPHHHQAVSMMPHEQPANTVVQVFQKGYLLEGRVVRPALVAVSQGPAA